MQRNKEKEFLGPRETKSRNKNTGQLSRKKRGWLARLNGRLRWRLSPLDRKLSASNDLSRIWARVDHHL